MNLQRFHKAQKGNPGYSQAFNELKQGRKTSHWIWYILPQLKLLGRSETAQYFGINNFKEACDYLRDPVLFKRYYDLVSLIELKLKEVPVDHLMGNGGDAQKLSSSLTLFREAASYLKTRQGEPRHDFRGLENRCTNIFALIASQNYFPCEATLSELRKETVNPIIHHRSVRTVQPDRHFPSVISHFEKPKRQNPPVKPGTSTSQIPLIVKALDQYKKEKKNEWKFHLNFLGLVAILYVIQDFVLGTDHFNNKNRGIALRAATKLQHILDPAHVKNEQLTPTDINALQKGQLGRIVNEHGGLLHLLQNAPKKHSGHLTSDNRFNF